MASVWITHSDPSMAQTLVLWSAIELLAVDKAADYSILILQEIGF